MCQPRFKLSKIELKKLDPRFLQLGAAAMCEVFFSAHPIFEAIFGPTANYIKVRPLVGNVGELNAGLLPKYEHLGAVSHPGIRERCK